MIVLMLAAGGLGAVARYWVDEWCRGRFGAGFPVGTLVVNTTGSFALGLVVGATGLSSDLSLVAGTGFLGGYTTFSTHAVETVRAWTAGRHGRALTGLALNLGLGLGAATIGLSLLS